MKTIYILLTRSDTVLSRIVHLLTSDKYTHASICFDEDLQTFYSSARKNGRTIIPAGPCKETLQGWYYSHHPEIPCALYKFQVPNEVYEKAKQEAARIVADADKYHFNLIGLILCRLSIPHHRKHYFFCSQFVGEVLSRSGALPLPKDTSLMRPCDYMHIPELSLHFQGHLCELPC